MIKIMEYMTFGKPIVQFHTTEGEVTAGKAAVYVRENSVLKFADTLVELLGDSRRRNDMGKFARKRVEEVLSWQKQKQNLINAYKKISTVL